MPITREEAFQEAASKILDNSTFVRAVLSGRRRNMTVEFERVDIRPVEIKGVLHLQLMQNDGRATTTKNLLTTALELDLLLERIDSTNCHHENFTDDSNVGNE
jgi:hypothetical protein